MTDNTERIGFWGAVKDAPSRMSLRLKLITALLVLAGLALAVTGLVGNAILKNYLLSPYDANLQAIANSRQALADIGSNLSTGNRVQQPDIALDFVADGVVHKVIVPLSSVNAVSTPFGMQPATLPGPAVQTNTNWLVAHSGKPFTLPAQSGDGQWRVLLQTINVESSNGTSVGTMVSAIDVTSVYRTTGQLASIDWIVGLIVLTLLGLIGVAVIRGSLRPLRQIEETAGAIAAGDLKRRVPDQDPGTEVGRLSQSLNVMLSQIETAFHKQAASEESARQSEERMRRFVADASHELRTPLTTIRSSAEYYRQRGGVSASPEPGSNGNGKLSPDELDRTMRRVEQESARMGVLVEDLLTLARQDQQRPLDLSTVDLLAIAGDAVRDARVVAPDREISLVVGSGAALLVTGDEGRLRQVVGNLMSNALAYTPAGSPIEVKLRPGTMAEIQAATATPAPVAQQRTMPVEPARSGQAAAVLEVTDHGPGLSAEDAQHVFERFYRADRARTTGGTGLGLAIVAALISAHGGAVWVTTAPGQGATFTIALPLTPEAAQDPGPDDELDAEN